jgi:integrase
MTRSAAGRRREVSDGYARGARTTLSAILTAAVDDGLLASNPCLAKSARPPRRTGGRKVVPWTRERVLAVADAVTPEMHALVLCGAGEGLRQGELLGLAVDDVDFLRRVIHVRRQVKTIHGERVFALPKGEKTRDVPLAGQVGLALSSHIADYPPVNVTLPWETPDGKPRAARLLFTRDGRAWAGPEFDRRVWERALRDSGIGFAAGEGDGVHALRHCAASSWLHGGCSIRDVAEFLGHSDPGFTLRVYAHLMPAAPDRMRAAADAALAAASAENVTTNSAKL